MKRKIRTYAIETEQLFLKFISVELVACDIRQISNVGLAVIFVAVVPSSRSLPVKTKVVFHQMFAEQVFFQVQYFGKVRPTDLHRGLSD
ncbi:MAG: hypothetical protein WA672_04015, partial [Candidatus Angelobacter sp.]